MYDHEFQIALLVGNADRIPALGSSLGMIYKLRPTPSVSVEQWASLGFASQVDFEAIRHRTDLIIISRDDGVGSHGCLSVLSDLLAATAAMEVVVMLESSNDTSLDACRGDLDILSWLDGVLLLWRRMDGGWDS
jgi:hypothetical protein